MSLIIKNVSNFRNIRIEKNVSSWNPSNLFISNDSGAWYDPSDLTTLFQDAAGTIPVSSHNDPVGLMFDKSGNGHHVTQTSIDARPLYKTDGTNHWLQFDGVDDKLVSTSQVFAVSENFNAYIGISASVADINRSIVTIGTTRKLHTFLAGSVFDSKFFYYSNGVDSDTNASSTSQYFPVGDFKIATFTLTVGDNISLRTDQVSRTLTQISPTLSRTGSEGIILGAREDLIDSYLEGKMSGCVLHTGNVIEPRVEEYLAEKSGVVL